MIKEITLAATLLSAFFTPLQCLAEEKLSTREAAKKLKWELTGVIGFTAYLGLKSWDWGSSNKFRVVDEEWTSMDTHSGGADKFGHMYSSYLMNELFTKNLQSRTDDKIGAAQKSALFSSGIMFAVEILDGYADDHGFSYEDLVFNTAGIGVSYLKNTLPGLDDKLDLRVEYKPSEEHSDHPITDYSGYTYLSALRLGGFDRLKSTPLKYVELQLGYHVEGFKKNDFKYYDEKKKEVTLGIGLNLSEIFFKPVSKRHESAALDYADTFFRYYQIPGSSVKTVVQESTRPF